MEVSELRLYVSYKTMKKGIKFPKNNMLSQDFIQYLRAKFSISETVSLSILKTHNVDREQYELDEAEALDFVQDWDQLTLIERPHIQNLQVKESTSASRRLGR
jgi:hypothetical protein